jgi:hypothetical protein
MPDHDVVAWRWSEPRAGRRKVVMEVESTRASGKRSSDPKGVAGCGGPPDKLRLDRLSRRNWLIFVAVSVFAMVVLAGVVLSSLGGRVEEMWPWAKTNAVLLAGLIVAVLALATYLTQQERRIAVLRNQLLVSHEEAAVRVRRSYDRLVALLNISRILVDEISPQNVFDTITQACREAFECRQASLLLLDSDRKALHVRSISGKDEGAKDLVVHQRVGEGLTGRVAASCEPLVIDWRLDLSGRPDLSVQGSSKLDALIVPIVTRGDLVGILSVSGRESNVSFEKEDVQAILLFAESVAICCRHAEQTSWMRQTIRNLDIALQRQDGGDHRKISGRRQLR